jgi:GTPase
MECVSGSSATLALRNIHVGEILNGMVLIKANSEPFSCSEFLAEIEIFASHSTTIKIGYEPIIHIHNIKQAAKLIEIMDITRKHKSDKNNDKLGRPVIRSGDKAKVKFRFCFKPV